MPDSIHLVEPAIAPDECAAVTAALLGRTPDAVPRFETALAARCQQTDAVTTATYEDAAVLLLQATGVGPGCEVLSGGLIDPRLAGAVALVGASLVCVDVDPMHLGPSADALDAALTRDTRAVFAGPIDGSMAMVDTVAAACVRHEVAFVEVVGPWAGIQTETSTAGARGRAALVDVGRATPWGIERGGGVVTSDDTLAAACRSMCSSVDGPMPAAMSPAQAVQAMGRLERIDDTMDACRRAAESYVRALAGAKDITLPTLQHQHWARFIVRLDDALADDERDEIIAGMGRHEIEIAPASSLPSQATDTCSLAAALAPRLIALPLHGRLDDSTAHLVAQTLELMVQRSTFKREA
ncbi:MAG: DegT/DnrJ/EryC1/StrS family aminotransferase [Phycisphaerales bacterium]|nr:DegT/DnrJ/EryC1/StrS family aminotransferase [Phycisphaerales bacterium]